MLLFKAKMLTDNEALKLIERHFDSQKDFRDLGGLRSLLIKVLNNRISQNLLRLPVPQ